VKVAAEVAAAEVGSLGVRLAFPFRFGVLNEGLEASGRLYAFPCVGVRLAFYCYLGAEANACDRDANLLLLHVFVRFYFHLQNCRWPISQLRL
jgi:hypothetical protein